MCRHPFPGCAYGHRDRFVGAATCFLTVLLLLTALVPMSKQRVVMLSASLVFWLPERPHPSGGQLPTAANHTVFLAQSASGRKRSSHHHHPGAVSVGSVFQTAIVIASASHQCKSSSTSSSQSVQNTVLVRACLGALREPLRLPACVHGPSQQFAGAALQ